MTSSLEKFFHPKGVAIIGASSSPEKLSYGILKNMTLYGYKGGIYPVNPKTEEILGLKSYPDISSVPDPVDLAVIILPANVILDVLKSCGDRGIRAVTVISGGFKEVGEEGRALEEKIIQAARSYQMRLIGPNCVGTINLVTGLNTTFIKGIPARGGIGFISQSGAVCGGVVDHVVNSGLGFSHFLSLGNEADVDETDIIKYLGIDQETNVIAAYIEGIQNGQKFLNVAKDISRKKPIVVLKAGRSEEGAKAVSSHTGSLAGSYAAYQAAFKQSGVIEVFSTNDLLNVCMTLDWATLPKGKRVAIVTNSGGPAALASDSLANYGLELASISSEIQNELSTKLNPAAQTANPIDMLGGANEEEYGHAMELVLKDSEVDMALVILVPQALVKPVKIMEAVTDVAKTSDKPIIVCMMGKESIQDARELLHERMVPMVDFPESVGVMFGSLNQYREIKKAPDTHRKASMKIDYGAVKKILQRYIDKKFWGERETRGILAACGFSLIEGGLASSLEESGRIAGSLRYPVALKVSSGDILHKSDAGAVVVGIKNEEELYAAYERIMENVKSNYPAAVINGVLVEKMAPEGHDVIVGVKRDPGFGPLVMFGMGGVFVELFKDVTFRISPLNQQDAEEMVQETKAYQLLNGWRGGQKCDLNAVYDTILRLSNLVEEFPRIQEIEINPLRVFFEGQGVTALDCRMILE